MFGTHTTAAERQSVMMQELETLFENSGERNELMHSCIDSWGRGAHLTYEQAQDVFRELLSDNVTNFQIGEFLLYATPAFLSVDEIAGFARVLRKQATPVRMPGVENLGDTCGTGGDTIDTFNISTTIMFILAAAGIKIAKHGNRAITSNCGSADVLEQLGVKIDLSPDKVAECINKIDIGFMFAPEFHSTTKKVQPVRKKIANILKDELPPNVKRKTVFNVLGPLANPAEATNRQVMGVYDGDLVRKIAEVFQKLQIERVAVVHGCSDDDNVDIGLDEVSTLGKTNIAELRDGEIYEFVIRPEDLGLDRAKASDIAGGDAVKNAAILKAILKGKKGPERDIVLANAALGLHIGESKNGKQFRDQARQYVERAARIIDDGLAHKKLQQLIETTQELGVFSA